MQTPGTRTLLSLWACRRQLREVVRCEQGERKSGSPDEDWHRDVIPWGPRGHGLHFRLSTNTAVGWASRPTPHLSLREMTEWESSTVGNYGDPRSREPPVPLLFLLHSRCRIRGSGEREGHIPTAFWMTNFCQEFLLPKLRWAVPATDPRISQGPGAR